MKKALFALVAVLTALVVAGCESDADKASVNISKEAEQFKVLRKIVGVNGITDKVEFEVIGRCSYEATPHQLVLTCKEGPKEFKKHTVGLSDNMFYISTQLESINVSVYRTKIILKPENIVPDLDLVTGESG